MKALLLAIALLSGSIAYSAEPVTVENFVRAETDHMIRTNMKVYGRNVGEFAHVRKPTTPDNQPVIRMNQDTL